jgi:hypothetical protein
VGSLVVDEGGILQGTCTRRGHKATVPAPKAAEKAPEKHSEKNGEKNGTKAAHRFPEPKVEVKLPEPKPVEAKVEELLVGAGGMKN